MGSIGEHRGSKGEQRGSRKGRKKRGEVLAPE